MQIHHVGYRIRGFSRLTQVGHRWDMIPHEAHHRLKILHFCARYGRPATYEAFGVSRRTLSRWQRALAQAGGDPQALAVRSRAPHRRRQALWPPALSQEIRRLRTTYPNLGKVKLHVLLRPWCAQQGLALPSVSTIGRLIARAPDQMRHTPVRLDARGRPKPRARSRKPRPPRPRPAPPLAVLAGDPVVRLHAGLRRYVFTFIDPCSCFAFAVATATASSRHATHALDALCALLPAPPRFLLSDNGPEFQGQFQHRLDERGLTHWWTYPRSPKMNAHAARFNRTLQEMFVDYHEDLLFDDLAAFHRKLADWLLAYNTVLPHYSLGHQTPVQFLLRHQPECQRWWTYTTGGLTQRDLLRWWRAADGADSIRVTVGRQRFGEKQAMCPFLTRSLYGSSVAWLRNDSSATASP